MRQRPVEKRRRFFFTRNSQPLAVDEESRFRQFRLIVCIGFPVCLLFGGYNWSVDRPMLALAVIATGFALLSGWWAMVSGYFSQKLVYRLTVTLFSSLLLYLVSIGGSDNSLILWLYLFPLVTFYMFGPREGLAWTGLLVVMLLLFLFVPIVVSQPWTTQWRGYSLIFAVRLLVTFSFVAIVAYSYEKSRSRSQHQLVEKNGKLLVEIAERERIEGSLRESEERYRAIYLQATEGIMLIDFHGGIVECNPQMLRMLAYPEEELLGRNLFALIHPDDLRQIPPQIDRLRRGETVVLERRLRTASGSYLHCELSGNRISSSLIILLYRDISARKEVEVAMEEANAALERLAHIDGLTGVANRRSFDRRLEVEWQRMAREGKMIGLLLGDIDYFKQYNDIYGHQAGDDCLKKIAATLASLVQRPADLVARYGGEEFVILVPDTDLVGCRQIAERMRQRVESLAIAHSGSQVSGVVTVSFGIGAMKPENQLSRETLVGMADKALYAAKQSGRNRVC